VRAVVEKCSPVTDLWCAGNTWMVCLSMRRLMVVSAAPQHSLLSQCLWHNTAAPHWQVSLFYQNNSIRHSRKQSLIIHTTSAIHLFSFELLLKSHQQINRSKFSPERLRSVIWKLSEQNARDDTIFAPSFMFANRVFNCTLSYVKKYYTMCVSKNAKRCTTLK